MVDYIYNLLNLYLNFQSNYSKVAIFYRKDAHCYETKFVVHFFFVTFSFWDMVDLYMIDFDVWDLMYAKDLRDFCEPDSDASQWGYSPQSKCMQGPGAQPWWKVWGPKLRTKFFFSAKWIKQFPNKKIPNFTGGHMYMKDAEFAETIE